MSSRLTAVVREIFERTTLAKRLDALVGGESAVAAIVVTNGGTGYTSAPTVGFTGGGGSGAAATAVVESGIVTAVNITNHGTGYTSTPTVDFTGGAGTGATATAVMGSETLDAIPTVDVEAGTYLLPVESDDAVSFYDLVAGTTAENSPFVIRPDDYAGSTNEKVWLLKNVAVAGVLLNGATQPASLVGGMAWKAGTAPSADVEDQVSLWVGDRDSVADRGALKIRAEDGTIFQLGDKLAIDSPASPVGGSQFVVKNNSQGAVSFLSLGAVTQQLGMGQFYDGTNHIASSANAMLWAKGSGLTLHWDDGQTIGSSYTPTKIAYKFVESNTEIRFGIGGVGFGNNSSYTLGILNGTAPTSNPSNGFQMWSQSGEPRFRTSGGRIRQLVRAQSHANATAETPTATHTLRMFDDGGTEYRVLAIAV